MLWSKLFVLVNAAAMFGHKVVLSELCAGEPVPGSGTRRSMDGGVCTLAFSEQIPVGFSSAWICIE